MLPRPYSQVLESCLGHFSGRDRRTRARHRGRVGHRDQDPIWRARHLPFGNGVMTLPQRGDTTLSMWAKDEPQEPKARLRVTEISSRSISSAQREAETETTTTVSSSSSPGRRTRRYDSGLSATSRCAKVGHKPGGPIRVLLTRANAPDISYRAIHAGRSARR